MAETEYDAYSQALANRANLDKYIIKSEVETHAYSDKERTPIVGNIVEIKPKYPNFAVADVPTANLPDEESEEEIAMRVNSELGMHLQGFAQDLFEDRPVDTEKLVKIELQEEQKIGVLFARIEKEEVLFETISEEGEKIVRKVLIENTPVYYLVEGEAIPPLFAKQKVKQIERYYMDLSTEVKRLNSNVMDRLGFTKARGMKGSAAIHSQHVTQTNVGNPPLVKEQTEDERGFHV